MDRRLYGTILIWPSVYFHQSFIVIFITVTVVTIVQMYK